MSNNVFKIHSKYCTPNVAQVVLPKASVEILCSSGGKVIYWQNNGETIVDDYDRGDNEALYLPSVETTDYQRPFWLRYNTMYFYLSSHPFFRDRFNGFGIHDGTLVLDVLYVIKLGKKTIFTHDAVGYETEKIQLHLSREGVENFLYGTTGLNGKCVCNDERVLFAWFNSAEYRIKNSINLSDNAILERHNSFITVFSPAEYGLGGSIEKHQKYKNVTEIHDIVTLHSGINMVTLTNDNIIRYYFDIKYYNGEFLVEGACYRYKLPSKNDANNFARRNRRAEYTPEP